MAMPTKARSTAAPAAQYPPRAAMTRQAAERAGSSSRRSSLRSDAARPLPGHGADNASSAQTLALQARCIRRRASRWCPRTSTCASRPRGRRACRGLLQRQARSTTRTCCTPARARWRRISGRSTAADLRSWQEGTHLLLASPGSLVARWRIRTSSYTTEGRDGIERSCESIEGDTATLELARDYRGERHAVWGIAARNREQNFALNLLMDPEIDFVTVLGPAGTGKTLLTLAAGLRRRWNKALRRNHHDARDDSAGRGHRLPARHRRGKDGAVDGRADGQPRGPDAEPGRRQLGPRRHQRPAAQSHQDPLAELHARPHLPEPLHRDPRRSPEPHAEADEGADHPRRPGTKIVCLGNIAQIDTPYLRDHLGPHLCRQPLPGWARPAT
jgi:PhoH-like ATPase